MEDLKCQEIINQHKNFASERNWDQFHSIKNLVMALSVESSELVEIFQWLTEKQSNNISSHEQTKMKAQEELADILIYLLRVAEKLDIDLNQALIDKMKKNALKYPIDKAKDNAKKYTEFI